MIPCLGAMYLGVVTGDEVAEAVRVQLARTAAGLPAR